MAVYTKVSDQELREFLARYDVGDQRSLKGIAEGVENTNFFLETTQNNFILTLYEKRVNPDDLPFFLELMQMLVQKSLPTAGPIAARDGSLLQELNGRPAALIQFLSGNSHEDPSPDDCAALGESLASLHLATTSYPAKRENSLGVEGWRALIDDCTNQSDRYEPGICQKLKAEQNFLEANWPNDDDLPFGVIHADLFPDNVLFTEGKVTGIIDFYFACSDFYAYDLAICLNAWCFDADHNIAPAKVRAMMDAYQATRPLNAAEMDLLPLLCRGASFRFLLTRLFDWLNQTEGALVTVKDPQEYAAKNQFHQTQKITDLLK